MSNYHNNHRRKRERNRKEKIGFYTAFSICLVAVCMAVYSTYNNLSGDLPKIVPTEVVEVNNNIQGITQTKPMPRLDTTLPTSVSQTVTEPTEVTTQPETGKDASENALETMLSTDLTLTYPLKSNNVLREYSENSVYFKTLNVWRPHTGVDFFGELGEDVCAMTGGAVTKVKEDKFYGKTVEISTNNAVCVYSGLGDVKVKEGDSVSVNDKIGVVGAVPCEATDKNHIHISVKINGNYADPLSFINNDE
ncbi:MAG: M23 family metallopeptidase [Ruminococcus sp.]|nr:M23 family metallopeptidase [Ruminococcus sp.]